LKEYTIKINKKEKNLLIYFMKKHLEINYRMLTATGKKELKEEIKIKENILKALGEDIELFKNKDYKKEIKNKLKKIGL
tara:strand:- start:434 stop:670 length:237 start_codon:yes stop_codon:yes gene_type:complete